MNQLRGKGTGLLMHVGFQYLVHCPRYRAQVSTGDEDQMIQQDNDADDAERTKNRNRNGSTGSDQVLGWLL